MRRIATNVGMRSMYGLVETFWLVHHASDARAWYAAGRCGVTSALFRPNFGWATRVKEFAIVDMLGLGRICSEGLQECLGLQHNVTV